MSSETTHGAPPVGRGSAHPASPSPAPARDLTGTMLTTGRLVLVAPAAEDIDTLYELCQDEAIQKWTSVPSPYEREHARRFVQEVVPAGAAAGTDAVFAVRHAVGGQILGMVGLQ